MPCEVKELNDVQSVEFLGIPSLDGKTMTTVRCYTPNKKNSRTSEGLVGALVYIHGGNNPPGVVVAPQLKVLLGHFDHLTMLLII